MKTWGLWGVVAIIMLAGCGGAAAPTATPPPTNTAVPTATFTSTTLPTSTPTASVTSTPTVTPTATPTSSPVVGTLKNPVPFGEQVIFTVPNIGNVVGLRLTKVVRGAQAERIINTGNEYMPQHPGEGEEFYAVYVEASHIDAKDGLEVFPLAAPVGWSAVVDKKLVEAPMIIMLEGNLMSEGLLPGGMTEGWVPFKVSIGATVSQIRFSMDPTKHNVWFDVENVTSEPTETASPVVVSKPQPKPTARPPAMGASRSNAVPFGQTAPVTRSNGKSVCEVAVTQVVRGDEAYQMMQAANPFNGGPADPNVEWMLVYMKGKCTKAPEKGVHFGDPIDMKVFADNRIVAQPLGGIPPSPDLQGTYFTGADIEGWTAFFVEKVDPRPLLFLEDSFTGDGGVWFALGE